MRERRLHIAASMTVTREGTGQDGEMQARLERLVAQAETLGAGRENRREALLERAESLGVGRTEAERAYDLALEEKLEPAYGLAVMGQGISVQIFGGGPAVEATESVEPEWIDRPPGPEEAGLERRLRETFRRLRSFMETESTPRDALARFVREPDLESYDY